MWFCRICFVIELVNSRFTRSNFLVRKRVRSPKFWRYEIWGSITNMPQIAKTSDRHRLNIDPTPKNAGSMSNRCQSELPALLPAMAKLGRMPNFKGEYDAKFNLITTRIHPEIRELEHNADFVTMGSTDVVITTTPVPHVTTKLVSW